MENIQNYKDALASVSKKEMEQRKTIKRLLQEKEELKKQLALYGVSQQRELLIAFAKYMEEDKMYARHDEANVDDFLDNHS